MTRTCDSCGRAWPSAAAFCGVCGALLDPSVAARPDPVTGRTSALRHAVARPAVGWAAAIAVVLLAVVAVPRLTVERTQPVDGEIGVPEDDELQAAPAAAPPRSRAPAPEVTCSLDDAPVPCVRWSRPLLPPEDPELGWGAWPSVVGDHLLLSAPDGIEGIDPVEGTRRWRTPMTEIAHPVDADEDVAVIGSNGEVALFDLDTGTPLWTTQAVPMAWGDVLAEELVVLADTPGALVGHDRGDGTPRWRWQAPWQDGFGLRDLDDGRLLVTSGSNRGMAVLDVGTGEELAITDADVGWLVGLAGDVAVTAQTSPRHRPGRAGDPGATLVGTDVDDLAVRWEQEVPSSDVSFGLVGGVVLAPSARLLTALDTATGQVAWELALPPAADIAAHADGWFPGLGAAPPDVVVVLDPAGDTVRGHDPATGALRWERATRATPAHAVVGGRDVVVHSPGSVEVLDAATGRHRVRIQAPADASLLALDPAVVAHPASGHLVGLDLP